MPNSGSGDPTDPLGPIGVGRPEALTSTDSVTGPDRSEAVEGPSAAQGATQADATTASTGTEAIASALANGEIDSATARAQLIEQAVRARLPADATPEAVAAIRAEVEAMVGSAPVLERLLRR